MTRIDVDASFLCPGTGLSDPEYRISDKICHVLILFSERHAVTMHERLDKTISCREHLTARDRIYVHLYRTVSVNAFRRRARRDPLLQVYL